MGKKVSNPLPPPGRRRPSPPPSPPKIGGVQPCEHGQDYPANCSKCHPPRDRGEDYITTLPDVCAELLPHAIVWRKVVHDSNVVRGVVHGQENRDEIEVLDKFINVCRTLGFHDD